MSVVIGDQGFSSRSVSSSVSMRGGMQLIGSGQTRISTGGFQNRTPSMYGGSGGFGTKISQSVFSSSNSGFGYSENTVVSNEKQTMQNLNDRLAAYLNKVRTLEAANRKFELQIREFYEKKGPSATRDYSVFLATIADLRVQILRRYTENQTIRLQIDNAQLAAEDFRIKYDMEQSLRLNVEADVARLRGVRDNLTLTISDLEMQIGGLKEELVYLQKNHEEELRLLRIQQSGNVNVEVDSVESVDLTKILEEVREQYEAVVVKNKMELEKWFDSKVAALQTQIITSTTEVKTFHTELSELKRTYQSLMINRQSVQTEIQCLQQSVDEVSSRYTVQLSQLQMTINSLEMELQQLRLSIETQQSEYKLLLDLKMRLEMEIAEYRRLLEGDLYEQKTSVVVTKVVEVKEPKHHIERVVKTIVEEIVDGRVVSTSVDTQRQDIES